MHYGTAIKKPIEIDWFKWEGDDFDLEIWVDSFGQKYLLNFASTTDEATGKLNLFALSIPGTVKVPEGFIIIRNVEGEYYPCDPEIFKKTYNKMIENKK